MNLCYNKMCSANLGFYSSKIIKFTATTCNHSRNYCNLSLPCAYPFKSQSSKTYSYTITNHMNNNLMFKISSISHLRYSKTALELPPPNPESTNKVSTSDIFGELGGLKYEKVELDEEELREEEREKNIGEQVPRKFKPRPGDYAKMVKNLVIKGDLTLAEEVIKLCIRNRDKPNPYLYSLIINAFAMQGDIQKCYKYYSDMKLRHFKIKRNIYTSLFNACANSPNSEKALNYLERVRNYMKKNEVPLNHAHYNVLVKAYGRHNQFKKAEKLVQYMIDNKLKIGISTLNSLMYAANTDTANGLCHIYSIWQFMRQQRVCIAYFSICKIFKFLTCFNLFFRFPQTYLLTIFY
jgi:pentatricopeptide repeat protein